MSIALRPLPPWLLPPQRPPQWPGLEPKRTPHTGAGLPRITVVTPSFNQAAFLETTIRSVLEQGYPSLDYHVIDGGSSDGSIEILRHYAPWLTSWVSEPDVGQADAIVKGLAHAEGEWFNWVNSDDLLAPGALWELAGAGAVDVYAGCTQDFRDDTLERRHLSRHITPRDLVRMQLNNRARWHQPAVWLRTDALRQVGIDASLHYRFDFDLLIRYVLRFPRVQYSSNTLAWFRLHADSKTQLHSAQFAAEHQRVLRKLMGDRTASVVHRDAREALEVLDWREEVRRLQNEEGISGPARFAAIVRAAGHTPRAWRLGATYDSLGRVLRAPRSEQKALAVTAWRQHVRALRNDTSHSRWDSVRAIVHAARRTPGAWRINSTYSAIATLLMGRRRG